jgi:hypothetical protein
MAICWQSALLVLPTTFASIYLSASSFATGVNFTYSIKSDCICLKKSFTKAGAPSSSASNNSETKSVISPFLTLSKKGIVSAENSSSKYTPTIDVSI